MCYIQNHLSTSFRTERFLLLTRSFAHSVDSPNTHAHTQHRDSCRSCVRRQKPNICRIDSLIIHRDFSIDVCGPMSFPLLYFDLFLFFFSFASNCCCCWCWAFPLLCSGDMFFFIFEHQSIEIHVVFHRSLRRHSARHYCLHYSRVMCSIVVCGDVHFSTTSTIKRYVYVCHWSVYTPKNALDGMRTCPHYNDGTKCPETLQTVKRNESPETCALVTHLVAGASSAEQANKWKIDKRTKNINTKCLSLTKTRDMETRDIVSILLLLLLLLLEVQLQQILPISIVYVSEGTHSKPPFLAHTHTHTTWCE